MIVRMEKLTALIFHKSKDNFLDSLQALGVVHVCELPTKGSPEELKTMQEHIKRADAFIRAAKKENSEQLSSPVQEEPQRDFDKFSYVQEYEKLNERIASEEERLSKLEKEIRNLEPWGNFSEESVDKLSEAGVNIRFFIAPLKKFAGCQQHKNIYFEEINRDKTYVYFVVFEKDEKISIDCDEFFYPENNMQTLREERKKTLHFLENARARVKKLFSKVNEVVDFRNVQESDLAYVSVSSSLPSAAEETVYILNGWLPVSAEDKVKEFLESKDIYYYFSKPQLGENIPVLLKNNRFAALFEPITKLFSLPNYAEIDLTAFFAPFFTLFFGFCLGDAGYGLIIFIGALIASFKLSNDKKKIAKLLMVLGTATCIFGMVSGNFFGIDLSTIQPFKKIVLFDSKQLFNLALCLGAIQVLFGMLLKAANRMRQFGFMAAVSTFGWIIMLCGFAALAISKSSIYIVYVGIILILLFNDLKSNIFVRIGKGLWELYGITGIFGDLLSYIRLFALGISSAILGIVVNDIAMEVRGIPMLGFILTFIILIVGHTGNILLSALSSFVHPLRLTFVEFYKSAGFEGGGKAYNPFRHIS